MSQSKLWMKHYDLLYMNEIPKEFVTWSDKWNCYELNSKRTKKRLFCVCVFAYSELFSCSTIRIPFLDKWLNPNQKYA